MGFRMARTFLTSGSQISLKRYKIEKRFQMKRQMFILVQQKEQCIINLDEKKEREVSTNLKASMLFLPDATVVPRPG